MNRFGSLVVLVGGLVLPSPGRADNLCRDHGMKHALFSIKADGTGLRKLRELPGTTPPNKLRISPDGKKVAFARCIADVDDDCDCGGAEYGKKELVLAAFDGKDELVIGHASGGFNEYPSWTADSGGVVFMHSDSMNPAEVDLFRYDLASKTLQNLTNSPGLMESDNSITRDGIVTVVAQRVVDGRPESFNDLYEVDLRTPTKVTRRTTFDRAWGRHCCVADAKYSPDKRYLVYAQLNEETNENWRIVLKDRGVERLVTDNAYVNQWPMWNQDGSRLLWVEWNPAAQTWSIVTTKMTASAQRDSTTKITLVGREAEFPVGKKKVIFGRVGWPDWQHPHRDRIVFSATYLEW